MFRVRRRLLARSGMNHKICKHSTNAASGRRCCGVLLARARFVYKPIIPRGRILDTGIGIGGFEALLRQELDCKERVGSAPKQFGLSQATGTDDRLYSVAAG
jgi:hypothetical protein